MEAPTPGPRRRTRRPTHVAPNSPRITGPHLQLVRAAIELPERPCHGLQGKWPNRAFGVIVPVLVSLCIGHPITVVVPHFFGGQRAYLGMMQGDEVFALLECRARLKGIILPVGHVEVQFRLLEEKEQRPLLAMSTFDPRPQVCGHVSIGTAESLLVTRLGKLLSSVQAAIEASHVPGEDFVRRGNGTDAWLPVVMLDKVFQGVQRTRTPFAVDNSGVQV